MIRETFAEARREIESAFDYYESQRAGLGGELLDEFERAVQQIIELPAAWQPLDAPYRQFRLRRFPYGIIYRVDQSRSVLTIISLWHLSRRPNQWRRRDR